VVQHLNPAKPGLDQRSWKSALSGAILAFASVTSALLITQALNSVFPTPLFFAAIVVSTWFGGVASGLLAVALATIELDYYFVPPVHRFALKAAELPYLLQFAIPGRGPLCGHRVAGRRLSRHSYEYPRADGTGDPEYRTGYRSHFSGRILDDGPHGLGHYLYDHAAAGMGLPCPSDAERSRRARNRAGGLI
jgi:hypothetical protein